MKYRYVKPSFIQTDEVVGLVLLILMAVVVIGGALGWVFNLVAIAHWSEGVGMLILRIIGVFLAPLGAILGWIK